MFCSFHNSKPKLHRCLLSLLILGGCIVGHLFVLDHATCSRACNFDVTSTGRGPLQKQVEHLTIKETR